nr:leucine-rich repeat-containing protein [Tanacetum cinerariifolium]
MMSWNTSTDCCYWNGITCDYSTGDVIRVALYCAMLQGPLHPNTSLFNHLPHLRIFDLSYNKLNGTLPSWLFTSPSLRYLVLRDNMFSGNVPLESFALPSLKNLYLNGNQLVGHTDMQTFQQLTNLTHLDLSFNNFRGEWELDTLLSNLTNLEILDLSYSGFSVTTNNANHYLNPRFSYLGLASCKLKVFPNSLRAMKQLEYLDLSSNEIHGPIPHWAGEIGVFASLNNKIHKCPKKQSEALLLFKHNLSYINDLLLNDFCRHSYPITVNWNTSTDCCNWNGVTCDDSTGDVIGLDVSCGLLKGTIHPNSSLFNLPHLQRLNLAYNRFDDSEIPSEIGRFSNSLTHLNLFDCGFSGQVPTDITFLHKLVSLDLSSNYNLKFRQDVFINMFRNFTHLEELSLEAVNISSVLPDRLNISSSLKLLNLQHTEMKGKLPHYIFNLHSLETLDLRGNSFTGDIPSKISANLTRLTYFDLSTNRLNGTLPSWLFTSPSLQYLRFYSNMFSGKVPFESFALPSLKELYLSFNQLGGQIDKQTFRQLTNLTVLSLSDNNFGGELELDALLTSLTNLEQLDLSYNGFFVTTKIANHYVNPRFRYLKLASCKLKMFPNSLRSMKQLEELDLSSNEIHGQIPHWAGEIGGNNGLSYLDLSHNFITGLPQFQWYGLSQLYLQSNLIQGPFPPSICNMSDLVLLDMSNNRFGGLIPQCFGNISSSLSMIDMGNNSFQGTIPNTYDNCGILEGLIYNGNQLRGEVPSSLSKCSALRVLDLGNNYLNGTFPSWLGGLFGLQVLVLKSNNLHGHIHPSATVEFSFPSLRVLDLSHNGFVGQLPTKYFQSFNSMKNVVKSNTTPKYLSMGGAKYYSFVVAVKGVNQDFSQISVDYTIIDMS